MGNISPKTGKLARELILAAKPFRAIYLINEPLDPPDDAPVHRYTPGAWPRMGELRRLKEAMEALAVELKVRL